VQQLNFWMFPKKVTIMSAQQWIVLSIFRLIVHNMSSNLDWLVKSNGLALSVSEGRQKPPWVITSIVKTFIPKQISGKKIIMYNFYNQFDRETRTLMATYFYFFSNFQVWYIRKWTFSKRNLSQIKNRKTQ